MRHPLAARLRWMPNHVDTPPELLLDPMPATPGVALVDPQMVDARELLVCAVQQQRHRRAILNVRRVHLGSENQATGIDQDVPFATVDAFGTVIATNAADTRRSNRLAVDDAGARLRIAADTGAELLAEHRVEILPGAVQAPPAEVVIRRLPGRELVRQQSPGAAAAYDVEDGVQDLAERVETWPANTLGWRQVRLEASPLLIRKIGQVWTPRWQTPAILPAKPTHVPVFRQFLVSCPRSS